MVKFFALSALVLATAVVPILPLSLVSADQALAWGRRSHYGHSYHGHRGETCWRTNRHTGQHFRIC